MSTSGGFGELDCGSLTALLFELASQLHIERSRRLALEAALKDGGILTPAQIAAAGEAPGACAAAAAAADESVRKLLRVLADSPDERAPLRAEAPNGAGDDT